MMSRPGDPMVYEMREYEWLRRISPNLRAVSHSTADQTWIEPPRVLYDHELMLFGEGQGVIFINGERFVCQPMSFFCIPPGREERSYCTSIHPWHRYWIHFDWHYYPITDSLPICSLLPQPAELPLIHHAPAYMPGDILHGPIKNSDLSFHLFERIEHQWNNSSVQQRLYCRAMLLELLLTLLCPEDDKTSRMIPRDDLAQYVKTQIEANATNTEISLAKMLISSGYSYAHAERAFRKAYGVSPLRYLQMIRIARAKMLLRDTELPIAEIAVQVGMADALYFSRLFRRDTGICPTQFRKEQPADEVDKTIVPGLVAASDSDMALPAVMAQ